jgi:hypothetical protein
MTMLQELKNLFLFCLGSHMTCERFTAMQKKKQNA